MRGRPARLAAVVVAAATALVTASGAGPATAATNRGGGPTTAPPAPTQARIQSQLGTLRDQEDAAAAREADIMARLESSRRRRGELDARVGSLDTQIRAVQGNLDGAESRLEQLAADLVNVGQQLSGARQRLAEARRQLNERAVAAYVDPTGPKAAQLLLRVRSLRELTVRAGYLRSLVNAQAKAVARFDALKTETERLDAAAQAKQEEARKDRDVVLEQRARLDGARLAQDQVRQAVVAEEAQQEGLLAEVAQERARYEAQIVALQQQSDAIGGYLRSIQAGQVLTVTGRGVLGEPIPGAPITSPFGPRVHPIFHTVRMHTGVDFGAAEGTPILAAGDGTVVVAGPYGGYGNATVVEHGGELATLYAHQSLVAVSSGQRVRRGQVIGYVGCTGYCTGPHLHFEVRVAGTPVDPLAYL